MKSEYLNGKFPTILGILAKGVKKVENGYYGYYGFHPRKKVTAKLYYWSRDDKYSWIVKIGRQVIPCSTIDINGCICKTIIQSKNPHGYLLVKNITSIVINDLKGGRLITLWWL